MIPNASQIGSVAAQPNRQSGLSGFRARYWRLRGTIQKNYSGGEVALCEMYRGNGAKIDVSGEVGVSLISGSDDGVNVVARAFDGLTTTTWKGASGAIAAGTSWIGLDFGVGNTDFISGFALFSQSSTNDFGTNEIWGSFNLEWSGDSVNWFLSKAFSPIDQSWYIGEGRTFRADLENPDPTIRINDSPIYAITGKSKSRMTAKKSNIYAITGKSKTNMLVKKANIYAIVRL